jgi:preprotein translocase subunit SecE
VADKSEKEKKPNAIKKLWRETIGELRKVAWPSIPEARRLTFIVLIVMVAMSALLGSLDLAFSKLISLILA